MCGYGLGIIEAVYISFAFPVSTRPSMDAPQSLHVLQYFITHFPLAVSELFGSYLFSPCLLLPAHKYPATKVDFRTLVRRAIQSEKIRTLMVAPLEGGLGGSVPPLNNCGKVIGNFGRVSEFAQANFKG